MSASDSNHQPDRTNSANSCQKSYIHNINCSAPGKIILSGEYSVVYGKHAVAASIDMRTCVSIEPSDDGNVRVKLSDFNHIRSWPSDHLRDYNLVSNREEKLNFSDTSLQKLSPLMDSRYIVHSKCNSDNLNSSEDRLGNNNNYDIVGKSCQDAVIAFLLSYLAITDSYMSSDRPEINVSIQSQLPVGCGLGSSSAYSVALCGALLKMKNVKLNPSKQMISEWAYQLDRHFCGTPSGIDNNIIAHGGLMLFQKGKIKQQITDIDNEAWNALLVDTCVARSSKTLCKNLADRLNEPDFDSQRLFDDIDKVTTSVWDKFQSKQYDDCTSMDVLLTKNQQLLDELGVGHSALSDIVDCCLKCGYCAKMTGAGGGGMAFVLWRKSDSRKLDDLEHLLTSRGYKCYKTRMGGDGVITQVSLLTSLQRLLLEIRYAAEKISENSENVFGSHLVEANVLIDPDNELISSKKQISFRQMNEILPCGKLLSTLAAVQEKDARGARISPKMH